MKSRIYMGFLLFLAATLISVNNCSQSPVSSNKDIVFPDSLVSYQQQVEPFLKVKCAFCPCHCINPQNGAAPMTDYFSLFSNQNLGLIVPLQPDASVLIQVIEEKLPHNPYFQKDYINDNQKKGLRRWILEGAKNN